MQCLDVSPDCWTFLDSDEQPVCSPVRGLSAKCTVHIASRGQHYENKAIATSVKTVADFVAGTCLDGLVWVIAVDLEHRVSNHLQHGPNLYKMPQNSF